MRVLLLSFLLLLAGCVTPPDAGDVDATAEGARVIPWALTECRYVVGWSEADPAVIQENLPEGFTVDAGAPLGLPAPTGPAARAIIGTEAFECASGSGLEGTHEPMLYGSIWIPVTPPEALAIEGISQVYYKIDVLVPDEARRAAMAERGLPVGSGRITWVPPTVPGSITAEETIEGVGDFRFEMVPTQSVSAGEASEFMEITPAGEDGADGFAIWRANYSWTGDYQQGRGTIAWPADHWVVDAIGAQTAPAAFHAGTWSFQGSLTLPAAR